MRSFVAIGEAMAEFSRFPDGTWRQGFAGDTLNVAWALRALSAAQDVSVAYLTRIGGDPFSGAFVDFLKQAGLGTDLIQIDGDKTIGLYTIETDDQGERSFTYWRGQSAARGLASDRGKLLHGIGDASLVYLSGITLAILPDADRATLLDALGTRGSRPFTVAFDPNIRPRLWSDAAAMRHAINRAAAVSDIVLPTFDDEAMAFGDADPAATLARYRALGIPEVVVKNGTNPTLYANADSQGSCTVAAPVRAVDTTGAGDSFNGAFLAARLGGCGLVDAIHAGQAAARVVVGQRGALAPMHELVAACAPETGNTL